MPELSVITVNLNNAIGLERTIKSVIGQTFTNFEFIVIDGNSIDGSKDVIKKYSANISKWKSETDTGIYNAMNKGINMAEGEYCLFLNSGDVICYPDTLATVFAKKLSEDIVYGNMFIEDIKGARTEGKMPDVITLEQLIRDTIWHPVSFIKKALFEKFGYYREDLKIVSDYDFFFKNIIINHVSTKHLNLPVAVFRIDGMSSNPENTEQIKRERKAVQEQYLDRKIIAEVKSKLKNLEKTPSTFDKIRRWFRF